MPSLASPALFALPFWLGLLLGGLLMLGLAALARHWQNSRWARRTLALDASRYPAVIQSAPDAVISIDEQQRIVLFNSAAERLLGCSAGQALGTPLSRFIPPELHELHAQWVVGFGRRGEANQSMGLGRDIEAVRADGSRITAEATISRLVDPRWPGGAQLYTVVLRDISARRQAQAELHRIQERYRLMVVQSPEAICLTDGAQVEMVNRACLSLLGAAHDSEVVGRNPQDFLPHDWAALQADAAQAAGTALTRECRITRLDGHVREVEVSAAHVPDHGHDAVQLVMRDITDRRLANEVLKQQHTELRRLSAQLTHAREEERRHLSRELHDELGQHLTALRIELAALSRDSSPALRARTQELVGRVDTTLSSVRRIAADLRPAMLDDLGLEAALEWLAKDWSARTGLSIHCTLGPLHEDITDAAKTAAYRIVQEALTNVSRHAQAHEVSVVLRHEGDCLYIGVEDDGTGLAPGATQKRDSHGLRGIRERARVLGGHADVSTRPQGGCRLAVRIPFARIDSGLGELQ